MQAAGFEVGTLCFRESYLAATRYCDRRFFWPPTLRGGALARRFTEVVGDWHPDFLVAGDELMVAFLARLFEQLDKRSESAKLLKFSFGNPASLPAAASKWHTLETARRLGLRVPDCKRVRSENEIRQFAGKTGWPLVMKQSFSWGGNGSMVCQNESEAAAILGEWRKHFTLKNRFHRWRKSIRGGVIGASWLAADKSITANQFITGRTAMLLAAAFEGRMPAAATAFKEQCYPNKLGPSSVVRFIHNDEMRRTAEKLIGTWGVTGFIGFDFIVDSAGAAWLIECNPRPTPISHLTGRVGEDVCRALFCCIAGQPLPPMTQTDELTVAHFPSESLRDPNSPHLIEAFHDIPWDDPDLLERLSAVRAEK